MAKRSTFLALIILISVSAVSANTFLVSDIDDTLKISHVRDGSDRIRRAFNKRVVFKGMPEFFNLLKKKGAEVAYLTNAPKWLMGRSHPTFLARNKFPQGSIYLRSGDDSQHHKINRLREIINKNHPSTLILLGDNGEHDSEFYKQIETEFPQIKILTFIRAAYPMKGTGEIAENHHSFVTPIEIVLELRDAGVLTSSDVDTLSSSLIPLMLTEKPREERVARFFPSWLECQGHQLDASGEGVLINSLARKIDQLCN